MGLGSILLGVFALVCMFGGFVLTFVPFLGTMLSFLAPVLSLAGIVLGGIAMSRAKETGENDGTAIAGLVINIIAFIPAMLVAVTCGLCNTVCTGMMLTPHDPNQTSWWLRDGGGASPFDQLFRDAGTAYPMPGVGPVGTTPPPAFPPPPIGLTDPSGVDPSAVDPSVVDPSAVDPSVVDPTTPPPVDPPPTTPPQGGSTALPPPPLPAGPQQQGLPPSQPATAGGAQGGGR